MCGKCLNIYPPWGDDERESHRHQCKWQIIKTNIFWLPVLKLFGSVRKKISLFRRRDLSHSVHIIFTWLHRIEEYFLHCNVGNVTFQFPRMKLSNNLNKNAFQQDAYRPLHWVQLDARCGGVSVKVGSLSREVSVGGLCDRDLHPLPPVDRQTPVKTLPSRNFVCRTVINLSSCTHVFSFERWIMLDQFFYEFSEAPSLTTLGAIVHFLWITHKRLIFTRKVRVKVTCLNCVIVLWHHLHNGFVFHPPYLALSGIPCLYLLGCLLAVGPRVGW